MADDLDDALFSLAAGRSKPASKKRTRKASESEDEGAVDSEADSEEAPRRKKPAAGSGSGGKRAKKVQSEEEEEDDDDDFDDEEGLFENEEDRRKLMAMTELDREMILADRAEVRDKERQRKQLLQQQRVATGKADVRARGSRPDKEDKARGGKAVPRGRVARNAQAARSARDWSDEDSEGGGKSSGEEEEFRPSSSGGSSEEEDGQAGRRSDDEEAGARPEAAGRGRAERGGAAAADGGAHPSGGAAAAAAAAARAKERERERPRERERTHADEEEAEEATLEELLACMVTRQRLEEWFGQPFFERDALNGCVVRMAYGPGVRDPSGTTHPGYMVMEITDIRESNRSYKFGPRSEPTHKHLALRDGLGITRVMAMANVSSKPFNDAEYERYKRHCKKVERAAITREEAAAAARKVAAATNYRWTSADLKVELERKRASRAAPVNPAAEKATLKRRLELAVAAGAVDEAAAIEEQLAVLEAALTSQGGNNQRAFGMMDINKRNKQHNLTVAYKTSAADEGGNDGAAGNDVFSRRETKLNIYWNTKASRGRDEADNAATAAAAAAAIAQAALPEKLTRAQQRMDPADLIRQLAWDVDTSLLRSAAAAGGRAGLAPSLQARVLPARWRPAALAAHAGRDLAGKSVLSIADWKRRAGEY